MCRRPPQLHNQPVHSIYPDKKIRPRTDYQMLDFGV